VITIEPGVAARVSTPSTLLLVDDNPVNLQVLLRTLDGQGHRLLVARDGQSAIDIARRTSPDLLLLDVLMPGIGGFDVCRTLKADAALSNIPIIFLSALGEVPDKVAGLAVGAVDYITKPIQPDEVLARVDVHLARHRLERELRLANQRLNRELSRAAEMQRLILPRRLPQDARVRFAAHYRTSRFVGGDYYDVLPLPGERYLVVTLDVSGHGAPAAIVMAMIRTTVHGWAGNRESPAALLRHLHDCFACLEDSSVYATAVCAVVDAGRGTLRVACAGHPPPVLWRAGAGASLLPCEATTPLLLMELAGVPETEHAITAGDRILFYTDGVTDRESASGDPYAADGLMRALARVGAASVEAAIAGLVDDLERFAGPAEPADDNTLLLLGID
jgi:sigma-B regulation protein RsbU (phosphoserine phosphatase)